jgi:DNA replication and repair protein RecF
MLAQAELFHKDHGEWPIVVMDDLASELDLKHQHAVLASLRAKTAQIFMTGTEIPSILAENNAYRSFHVEQGQVQALL